MHAEGIDVVMFFDLDFDNLSRRDYERLYITWTDDKAFELDKEAAHAADRAAFLDTRFQWSKTQLLAGAAIVTFILKNSTTVAHFFEWLKNLVMHGH